MFTELRLPPMVGAPGAPGAPPGEPSGPQPMSLKISRTIEPGLCCASAWLICGVISELMVPL
jgi:hypothetical protein